MCGGIEGYRKIRLMAEQARRRTCDTVQYGWMHVESQMLLLAASILPFPGLDFSRQPRFESICHQRVRPPRVSSPQTISFAKANTYVSSYRRHLCSEISTGTRSRVESTVRLHEPEASGRSSLLGSLCSHNARIVHCRLLSCSTGEPPVPNGRPDERRLHWPARSANTLVLTALDRSRITSGLFASSDCGRSKPCY